MQTSFCELVINGILKSIQDFSNSNALYIDGKAYTYGDLSHYISKIRLSIKESSCEDKAIGLVANDDIETYASIFALWFEGKCYVPLHPNQPKERCLDIINQVSISLVLDSSSNTRYTENKVVNTSKLIYKETCLYYEDVFSDEDLAYILFTSGSTGQPKGVTITRKNLSSFVDSFFAVGYTFSEKDKALQCFDLTFDFSVVSYVMPMLKGACIYTVPHNEIKFSYIYGLIDECKLTILFLVPSTIKYLKPYFEEINAPTVRYCIFCGEALPLGVLTKWVECIPNAIIDNFYGPTEDTVFCSYYRYNRDGLNKAHNGALSIGKPMKGCILKVLNEDNLEETKPGNIGELCIAGNQLSPGYWNNPEKNSSSFFIKEGIRYYKSGDACFTDEEGDIMYVERMDFQTKIQGYRVELGEIEYHAQVFLKELHVAILALENSLGNKEIVLFIESSEFSVEKLLEYLKSVLPGYMIPSKITFVPRFPLNTNGKLDRGELQTFA